MFRCCEQRRLEVLRRSGSKNAIEFLEVLDHAAPPGVPPQQTLFVRLLHPVPALPVLTTEQVRITGGERIPTVAVEWVAMADNLPATAEPGLVDGVEDLPRTLVVRTRSTGDFSRYRFALVRNSGVDEPPDDFDPVLSIIDFSFKVECPTDFDCDAPLPCEPAPPPPPRIDYLAKDYAGFRRLMLDRLSLLTPGWTERSAADVGVTLVEVLAFAADTLSYRQDVIANEAYLNTARQRVSVRRHARLVDYYLHEGCNARAFVHFKVTEATDEQVLPTGSTLLTQVPSIPKVLTPDMPEARTALESGALVFETVHEARLHPSLNRLSLYTWGDASCCLPRGATSTTLAGGIERLKVGDFLVFQEVVDPKSLEEDNADPAHRHVVRLTRVALDVDPSGGLFLEDPQDIPVDITRIEWDASDALPFSVCVSVRAQPGREMSVVLGNIVLAEHGVTIRDEQLSALPATAERFAAIAHVVGECCDPPEPAHPPLRYRPTLAMTPLTHGFNLAALLEKPITNAERWSAAALRALHARDAMPRAQLLSELKGAEDRWTARRDLLSSDDDASDFVVEIEDSGRARLRFGDDAHGRRPDEDTGFKATYRIGNGTVGNVGAQAIAHLLIVPALAIDDITNPLAAFGGVDPEDIEVARRDAPQAFRTQERAVTAADYARAAERRADVQRAAATFRWTGSWHTAFLTADRLGGAAVGPEFESALRRHLERFRMAGYDLEVDSPRFVSLDVSLHVCVKPNHFRSDVVAAVRDVLGSRMLPDGRLGAFHPDNFTFGQAVYASRIVATAQAVEGVASVRLDKFQRLADPEPSTIEDGVMTMGKLEIARLENNPNFRDRGRLTVTAGGGK